MDPVFLAQSKLRRRKYDECIEICTDLLARNPYDQVGLRHITSTNNPVGGGNETQTCIALQAVWYLKAQALTEKNYVDDTEMDEEGAADLLLDENQRNAAPRWPQKQTRPPNHPAAL